MNRAVLAWIKASRLPSQLYLLLSLLWGQSYSFYLTRHFSYTVFFFLVIYGISNQLYIVFGNDVADFEADRKNEHYTSFSGGSRVLVLGLLEKDQLFRACKGWAVICFGLGVVFSIWVASLWPLILVLLALGLLWAYSFPPLSLSYRGGGEMLQVIGLGIILPLLAFILQGGQEFNSWWLVPLLLIQLSCAFATALPDRVFDKKCGKNTTVVRLGQEFSCRIVFTMNCISIAIIAWILFFFQSFQLFLLLGIPFLSSLGFILLRKSEPGRFLMSLCVFLAILSSLSQMVIMTAFFITA